jgi:NADH-quinone oxidoreductase subunit H
VGEFKWSALVYAQGFSPLHWTAFSNPFQFVAFVTFLLSGLVLLAIAPMDSALSSRELHGGVAAHLSGYRYSIFQMGRFYGFFLWSIMTVALFLGGWSLPHAWSEIARASAALSVLHLLEIAWLLLKTFLLMLTVIWVAQVNPKSRVDQVTDFSWRILSPFAILALVGSSVWAAVVAGLGAGGG